MNFFPTLKNKSTPDELPPDELPLDEEIQLIASEIQSMCNTPGRFSVFFNVGCIEKAVDRAKEIGESDKNNGSKLLEEIKNAIAPLKRTSSDRVYTHLMYLIARTKASFERVSEKSCLLARP